MFLKLGQRRGRPHADIPLAVLVPNMLTTLALCCGLASLHFVLSEKWEKALAAIVLAAIFDVLDGGAARLLRVQSKFGAVLDSLSDFLAFGVAPAMILHQWILLPQTTKAIDTLGLMAVMVFALCAAMRLARFTAAIPPMPTLAAQRIERLATRLPREKSRSERGPRGKPSLFFVGMPTPGAAGAALVPACLAASDERWANEIVRAIPEWGIAAYVLLIAVLMVSRVPMFALKGVRISPRSVAPVMIGLVVLATLMLRSPWATLAGLGLLYVLLTPVAMWAKARTARPDASMGVVVSEESAKRGIEESAAR